MRGPFQTYSAGPAIAPRQQPYLGQLGRVSSGSRSLVVCSIIRLSALLLTLGPVCVVCSAQTKRLVLIKVDGLPFAVVDRAVKERDPTTGKSKLPWIDYIYYRNGARLAN